jgi:hypothetical protein
MVSTGEVQEYLHGMDYPAGKNDLISKAKSNNAPQEVIDILGKLPDQRFSTPIDVNKAIGDIE